MDKHLLRTCRAVAGFTQSELASAIGKNQSTLSHYENGLLNISETTKRKVIKALEEKGLSQDEVYLLSGLKKSNQQ
ncbi:helix-turn-helix domain-containing protein [Lentibacillus jeotgali]|uniref:helix-turn-helix domain-containing protein n=1 Tax=Lentibacillus jeotgali TaxID=558169 RepID=UPI00026258A0|nr:helix-turn-helix transcriptional regulator [Lentibacillus jeotgali]